MLIPESLKKEAIRRVRQDIESEITKNLTIDLKEKHINNPWVDGTREITVKLKYKDKEISSKQITI